MRETERKHTETPWSQSYDHDNKIHVIYDTNGIAIAHLVIRNGDMANAAHIVKCVNSHDELVEALKIAKQVLTHDSCWSNGPSTGDPIEDYVVCPGCRALKHIEQTLSKAGAR